MHQTMHKSIKNRNPLPDRATRLVAAPVKVIRKD